MPKTLNSFANCEQRFKKNPLMRMTRFCNRFILFLRTQVGIRQEFSCVFSVGFIIDFTKITIEKKCTGQAWLLDLKKVFVSFHQAVLLPKILNQGYRGPTYNFLIIFLFDRWKFFEANRRVSEFFQINTGVVQSSVLGNSPLLLSNR